MQKITPNLWFDDQSEEAANFYAATFDHATVGRVDRYTDAGKEQHGHNAGEVMSVEFEIEGQPFVAINGGPMFTITPAISFFVNCKTADEVNGLWAKLADGGEVLMPLDTYPFSERYGWLNDKFGVSWQIILTEGDVTQKIIPSLLFTGEQTGNAEEAMQFYAAVFPDSRVGAVSYYGAHQAPDKEGTVMYGELTLLGQRLAAMDSAQNHDFGFSEAVSLMVECATQDEIDTYWEKLSAVPDAEACGWLKDKYGVSWQIVPTVMNEMLKNGTPQQLERVTAAFMQMKKFNIAELEHAYNQG
jgi:predicted 3-demethylubiquinone-9 3-methyltransferase (glyoxalase superfamily)